MSWATPCLSSRILVTPSFYVFMLRCPDLKTSDQREQDSPQIGGRKDIKDIYLFILDC